jgi:hypothetical protein
MPSRKGKARKVSKTRPSKGGAGGSKVASTAEAYWRALLDAGYLEGPVGDMTINEGVRMLLDASYEVLAGGQVSGSVPGDLHVTSGVKRNVERFKRLRAARLKAINQDASRSVLKARTG